MTPEQFRRVEELFEKALELPSADRAAFLHREAAGDDQVRSKVEGMLQQDSRSSDLPLTTPALGFRLSDPDAIEHALLRELLQTASIRVIEKLGEGGFGAVYKAEQLHPVRRLMAVKVIKLGMDTQQVLDRFQAERQALAIMDHPAIAKVYEAGATPSGRPYFAMELVDGVPITRFCDEQRMDIDARLDLFVRVCQGVQHAHQKGIIHRDLKPGNVLVGVVDGQPSPRIIDFGIARAVGDTPAARPFVTAQGQPLGTPVYMSPEQAAGNPDIDTRTDVYSLGVLLYELLTGEPSLDLRSTPHATPAQVVDQVLATQAEPPSRRVRESARREPDAAFGAHRGTTPALLSRRLRGDLDCIVLTALEHDRSRRYETVAALGEDVERYLTGEPVRAHPPSAGYRLHKYIRRNRVAIAIVGLIVAALIGTAAGLARSISAEARARTDARIAQEINAFLNDDLLSSVDPNELGSDARVRDVLNAASRRVEGRFAAAPEVEAAVRLTLGRTYSRLGEVQRAATHLDRALKLREALFAPDDPRVLEAVHEMGELRTLSEDYSGAESLLSRAHDGRRRVLGESDPRTLESQYALGVAMAEQGRFDESHKVLSDTLLRCRQTLGPSARQTRVALRGLAVLATAMDKPDAALALYEECYALSRTPRDPATQAPPPLDPITLLTMQDLAGLLLARGENARALQLLSEAVEASKTIRGEQHAATLMAMGTLARAYQAAGDTPRAVQTIQQAIDFARQSLPAGHGATLRLTLGLAAIHDRAGDHQKAEELFRSALETSRERLGEADLVTKEARQRLAAHYRARGMNAEADRVSKP